MKIAMISEHANPLAAIGSIDAGGQNVHVAGLSKALVTLGHDVTVFTRRDDETTRDVVCAQGVSVHHIAAGPPRFVEKDRLLPFMETFANRLSGELADGQFDVAHAHFWMSGYAMTKAVRLLDVATVQTYHALGIEKRRHQEQADTSPAERIQIEREILHGVDRVVATSSAEIFELMRMGADAPKLKIVPCGVDLDFFDGTHRRTHSERRFPNRIATLSRLVPRKGIADVIQALAAVPDTELVIGGSDAGSADGEVAHLRSLAAACGVGDRVFFCGAVDRADVPAFLSAADVVVCASWYEPFGIVPLEAMACGIPVVATAVGGQNDTVMDGFTGFAVRPREPQQIATALNTLLASPSLRASFGAAGRRRVEERFTWARVARETERVYRGIRRRAARADASA